MLTIRELFDLLNLQPEEGATVRLASGLELTIDLSHMGTQFDLWYFVPISATTKCGFKRSWADDADVNELLTYHGGIVDVLDVSLRDDEA